MLINLRSRREQGPWDPDEKKKYIDTTNLWVSLPLLVLLVVIVGAGVYFSR